MKHKHADLLIAIANGEQIQMNKNTDDDYIAYDPFQGDEAEISCRTVAIRTAKKEHQCFVFPGTDPHTIKPGDRYRHERALVDRSFWGNYRICLPCLDKWIDEVNGNDDEETKCY